MNKGTQCHVMLGKYHLRSECLSTSPCSRLVALAMTRGTPRWIRVIGPDRPVIVIYNNRAHLGRT